jgi:hypothetical protein
LKTAGWDFPALRFILPPYLVLKIMKSTETENTAHLLAERAQAAASPLKFQRSAELYEQAASTNGLEVPVRWKYRNEQALMLAEQGREFRDNAALEKSIECTRAFGAASPGAPSAGKSHRGF